uniref:60S ribosomal protein L7 n=1 Tax=Ditylenchus dipsaci TaxID=166011 RepID=A0A915ERR5_9BILA
MVEAEKFPSVPETLLKRRKNRAALRAGALKNTIDKQKKTEIFKRAKQYLVEYRKLQKTDLVLKREAKKAGNYYVPDKPKLAFVVRIRGIGKIHPRSRKVLQLLHLRQITFAALARKLKFCRHQKFYQSASRLSLRLIRSLSHASPRLEYNRRIPPPKYSC